MPETEEQLRVRRHKLLLRCCVRLSHSAPESDYERRVINEIRIIAGNIEKAAEERARNPA